MNVRTELEALGVTVWGKAGGGVRVHGLSTLPPERREEALALIRAHKAELAALPPLASHGGPDYAAWCDAYHRGCFACPDFLRDRVRFCRKWNRTFNGVDVVELEIIDGADASPLPEPALPEEDTGRGWWTYGREVNGMVNTVDHKKGEVLTS